MCIDFSIFTEQQYKAITVRDGINVVMAVPGAGKTTGLIAYIANLIYTYQVPAEKILPLTFSKAAAVEMRERFDKTYGDICKELPTFSTIHSFSWALIRQYYYSKSLQCPAIIDAVREDSKGQESEDKTTIITKNRLLKNIYLRVNNEYISDDQLEELISNISLVKNAMHSAEENFDGADITISNFADIYLEYEKFKRENNLIDYDDMLTQCHEVLLTNEGILNKYRKQFDYIVLDEAQDTSKIQWCIVKLLAAPKNNMYIVADDDQSLYSWRGSDPKELLEFQNNYPDTKMHFIEQNFRSTQSIIQLSNEFIKGNLFRYRKNMFTKNDEGEAVKLLNMDSDICQYNHIISELKKNQAYKDYAVLYRTNLSAIPIADSLDRNNIPFYMRDYNPSFFTHWIVKDFICFFELMIDNRNVEAYSQIYYKLSLYLSKQTISFIKDNLQSSSQGIFYILQMNPTLPLRQKNSLEYFGEAFSDLADKEVSYIIEFILKKLGYGEYLLKAQNDNGFSEDYINSYLSVIKYIASGVHKISDFKQRLKEIQCVMENAKYNKSKDAVLMSTIHSSKGMEFNKVFVVDMIQNQFPGNHAISEKKNNNLGPIEEERRLCYVSMTRARHELTMITYKKKNNEKVEKSIFFTEIENILNYKLKKSIVKKPIIDYSTIPSNKVKDYMFFEGSTVVHKKFGEGEVVLIDSDNNYVDVNFELTGTKRLALDVVIKGKLLRMA